MQETLNFLISFFIYIAIFVCILQVLKKYRQLNEIIDETMIKRGDAFSFRFIDKIFHHRRDEPAVRKLQESIVRNSALILLLLFCGRFFL